MARPAEEVTNQPNSAQTTKIHKQRCQRVRIKDFSKAFYADPKIFDPINSPS